MSTIGIDHLESRPTRAGALRVFIRGTRVRVQDIASLHEFHGESADEISRGFPALTLGQIHAALSYFYDHRELILAELQEDAAFAESMKSKFSTTDTGDSAE